MYYISKACLSCRDTHKAEHFNVLLYYFPIVAVKKNDFKCSGLNNTYLLLLQFQMSEVQNESHWAVIQVLAGLHSFSGV